MPNNSNKPAIYISYAWGSESEAIAEHIEIEFQKRDLPIKRDKNVLEYKGGIKAFMEQIGRAEYIILVISNKYLHSANCMFELIQIFKNEDFHERIFPVVLNEVNIYDASERVRLMKYWEEETEGLNDKIRELKDFTNIQGITDDLNLTSEIRHNIARLTDILKDTNTLSIAQMLDTDFDPLVSAVKNKISKDSQRVPHTIQAKDTSTNSERNDENIFVKIKAKLFGTTAFFEIGNRNRRKVISFGITAVLGICAIFLAVPHLFQGSVIEAIPGVETQVGTTDSVVVDTVKDSKNAGQSQPVIVKPSTTPISNVRYNVELVVPSNMAKAEVFVDGKSAEIVERSPISITVRLRKKESSHHFMIKDGKQSCTTDKLISSDNMQLPLCD